VDRRPAYDVIGVGYPATRREDPRIAQAIWEALGDAASVANIGAGTGNYEPSDRDVIAVEPSELMIAQRPAGAAPAVQGTAEDIPLADASVDAAMAVITDHHWADRALGLAEMGRVARQRVVALTIDFDPRAEFWLTRDYLTEYRPPEPARGPGLYELALASSATIRPVPVPHDCADGFALAFWRRPSAYLDPGVRAGISVFHQLDGEHVERAMQRLADDLASGRWKEQNQELLDLDELDLGLRLVAWEKDDLPGR
jgi:SAM-dependent methyltransferase